jgi:PPOX class probable F420-dependent enzyme
MGRMHREEPTEPTASRPYMPGYGTLGPDEGTGLLPWSWARERLERSHDYWLATTWPDGRPHVMPVWGVWHRGGLWFSSSRQARKVRNLLADPRCVATTDTPRDPVVVEGRAEMVDDMAEIRSFVDQVNLKYEVSYTLEFFNAPANACVRVRPVWAFALAEGDFTGSPTRWQFDP